MNRLGQLNMQLSAGAAAQKKASKPKGNMQDTWDYLGMDEFLSNEAKQIRDKCRAFAERYNAEMYDYAESSNFPHYLIPEIAKLGFVGADCSKEVGGKGLSCADVGSFMFELAKKDASLATFVLLHHSLGQYTIYKLA